jgi:hypothetical protein
MTVSKFNWGFRFFDVSRIADTIYYICLDKPIIAAINIGSLLCIEKLYQIIVYQEWETGVSKNIVQAVDVF